ncbi:MAG: hypothetical protein DRP13_04220 [Candidatus Aenigmatarchaeota archaeon]|nr:MAG: hypothetical protein DRP13_04220 [Candidatus Aenigmarchaeota archaeon]
MFRLKQTATIEKHLNLKHSVLRISSTEIITCTRKDKVLDAVGILARGIKRIPVTDGKEELKGVLTPVNVLDYLGAGKLYNHFRNFGLNASVGRIMFKNVKTIDRKSIVKDALECFLHNGQGFYPVVDNKKIVAIISEWDIIKHIRKKTGILVDDVMSKKIITAKSRWPVNEVAEMMVKGLFKKLPVVEENILIGMITPLDIIHYLKENRKLHKLRTEKTEIKKLIRKSFALKTGADIYDAVRVMKISGTDAIPVIEDERIKGLITRTDIIEALVTIK